MIYQSTNFGSNDSNGLKLTGTGSGYLKAVCPTDYYSTSDNVSYELKIGSYSAFSPQMSLYDSGYTSQGSVNGDYAGNRVTSELGGSDTPVRNSRPVENEVWKIVRENGQSKLYIDDVLLQTVTRSVNDYKFGFYTSNPRWEYIKYIKIKKI